MSSSSIRRTVRLRREAWGFMVGSAFFALGAVPWYADAVGPVWGSATFFVGSIFFTFAGLLQLLLSGRLLAHQQLLPLSYVALQQFGT